MDPHSGLREPVAPVCVTCSQACERKNGHWVCINCDFVYKYGEGNLEIVSQDSPTTFGNGVVFRPLSGAQEQGHQPPSPCLPKAADKHENHKDWTFPDVVEQDSLSGHDQTRDGSAPTLSQVYALQGSCDSVDNGLRVIDDGPSQERGDPDDSYESMDLDTDEEEPNDEAFHSWLDETTGPGLSGRQRGISHALHQVAVLGLDPNISPNALQNNTTLEISDDTDMEE